MLSFPPLCALVCPLALCVALAVKLKMAVLSSLPKSAGDVQGAMQALLACYHDRVPLQHIGQAARAHFQHFYDRPVATEKFWCLLQRLQRSD
jgi:hypothetical protein